MIEPPHWSVLAIIGIIVLAVVLPRSIKVLREHQRGVIFKFGRVQAVREPGLVFLVPWVQRMAVVDLRTVTIDVPAQAVMSRDHVSMQTDAVIHYRVGDPEKAVTAVDDVRAEIGRLAQTALRTVIGQYELNEILAERDMLHHDLHMIVNRHTQAWGIKVSEVEIRQIDLDEATIRELEKRAEAERLRRAQDKPTSGANQPVALS